MALGRTAGRPGDELEAMQRTQLDGEGLELSLRLWGWREMSLQGVRSPGPRVYLVKGGPHLLPQRTQSLAREDIALSSKNKDISFYLREIFFLFLYTFFSSRK